VVKIRGCPSFRVINDSDQITFPRFIRASSVTGTELFFNLYPLQEIVGHIPTFNDDSIQIGIFNTEISKYSKRRLDRKVLFLGSLKILAALRTDLEPGRRVPDS
jgi:hypothetical protein